MEESAEEREIRISEDDVYAAGAEAIAERVAPRHGAGRRRADQAVPAVVDIQEIVKVLPSTWQSLGIIALAIMAGAGGATLVSQHRGLPARVTVLEAKMATLPSRVSSLEREAQISRQMWRDVRYLVCRSREYDAGRSAKSCEYLYDTRIVPPIGEELRDDTLPVSRQPDVEPVP